MRRMYSNKQLEIIRDLIKFFGHLYYNMGSQLENEYYKRSGDQRSSGALYMVAWRLERGDYTHRGYYV